MCKLIAELVGTDKRILREMISRLERASGNPGVDLHLTGEIYGTLHMKMRALGLDPNDTTPHELYQALLNIATLHDQFLANRIGVKHRRSPAEVLPAAVDFIHTMHIPGQAWALKHSAAKRLLKVMPPKTLMKLLHYRSVDSLLKREPIGMLFTAARHIEPGMWQQRFAGSYKRLQSSDFEVRQIEVMYMHNKRWQQVGLAVASQQLATIIYTPEIAAISVLQVPSGNFDGLTLATLLLIIHYVSEIKTYSTHIKFRHMYADFGGSLIDTVLRPTNDHVKLAGQPIHWRVIHRYYGSGRQTNHPEIFEPHLQPEDFAYRKAEELLYRIEPALHFWHNLDYVGLPQATGNPISFNLTDTVMNIVNHNPYEERTSYHLRDSLWNELYGRYVGQSSLERQVLRQLDDEVVSEATTARDIEFVW